MLEDVIAYDLNFVIFIMFCLIKIKCVDLQLTKHICIGKRPSDLSSQRDVFSFFDLLPGFSFFLVLFACLFVDCTSHCRLKC